MVYDSPVTLTANQLAGAARLTSASRRVDPGVVILNYGHNTSQWPVAMSALKIIETKADAVATVLRIMQSGLSLDRLSGENREFLLRVTDAEP